MRSIGDGTDLWYVRVVMKTDEANADAGARLLPHLENLLTGAREDFDLCTEVGIGETGDTTIGANYWVRADDVGEAARIAVRTMELSVQAAGVASRGLYEVTVVPRHAVVVRSTDPSAAAISAIRGHAPDPDETTSP